MRRRVLGFVAALLLAIVGTTLLVSYVKNAEDRALAGEEVVEVLVVQEEIRQGTAVADIGDRVATERVPTKVAIANAVTDLTELEDLVASVTLLAGEQLSADRFATQASIGIIDVPEGLVEVTVSLSPERAMVLDENDIGRHVSVLGSFESFQFDTLPLEDQFLEAIGNGLSVTIETTQTDSGDETATVTAGDGSVLLRKLEDHWYIGTNTPDTTATLIQNTLVTRVTFEEAPEVVELEDGSVGSFNLAPTGNLLVTLAVSPGDAQEVIFAAEHGGIWLALEEVDGLEEPGEGIDVQDRTNIHGIDPNASDDLPGTDLVVDAS